jgi:hypothetical protein
MLGPLAIAIEQELDRLAQLEQFPHFISKLQATITPKFKVAKSAAHWSRLIAEEVVDMRLTHRFVLRRRNREIVIVRRPNVSTTDALKKLANCSDWERAWFGLPNNARYLLNIAEARTRQKMEMKYYDFHFQVWFPTRESVIPLIDPAIALVPVFNTNSKSERDELLGRMLRMWRVRNIDGNNGWTASPDHDEAWKLIERIEACYRPFFVKYDPAAAAPRKGFDIPLRKATREGIYERFVLERDPEVTIDIEARLKKALSPWISR